MIDGAALERILQREIPLADADLIAAKPHWVILEDMAAVLLGEDTEGGRRENDNS